MTDIPSTNQVKKCGKCQTKKLLTEFSVAKGRKHDRNNRCKACARDHYLANKDRINEQCRNHYSNNKESIGDQHKEYRKLNKQLISERVSNLRKSNGISIRKKDRERYMENKTARLAKNKKWSDANKEMIAKKNLLWRLSHKDYIAKRMAEYRKERCKTDYVFAMKIRIRTLIRMSLINNGYTKKSRTYDILGCDYATFLAHIESTFTAGMSWDVRHKLHIDHIIPLASAKTEEEVLRLNHYTNLQMLWKEDNLAKRDIMPSQYIRQKLAFSHAKAVGKQPVQQSLI